MSAARTAQGAAAVVAPAPPNAAPGAATGAGAAPGAPVMHPAYTHHATATPAAAAGVPGSAAVAAGAHVQIPEPPNMKRLAPLPLPPERPVKRRRGRGGANNKGLRHFSMKVCQKVEEKGKTTYNEVADELVKEFQLLKSPDDKTHTYDEKNIRRRVYDALNVLMAMDIIKKERKEITWQGLPSNSKDELEALRHAHSMATREVEKKKQHLQELLLQQLAFKKLLELNQKRAMNTPAEARIHLPFIVVSTSEDTTINLQMDTPERRDLFFDFSAPFEIQDEHEMLMRMNLHNCSAEELRKIVPHDMLQYLPPSLLGAAGLHTRYDPHGAPPATPPAHAAGAGAGGGLPAGAAGHHVHSAAGAPGYYPGAVTGGTTGMATAAGTVGGYDQGNVPGAYSSGHGGGSGTGAGAGGGFGAPSPQAGAASASSAGAPAAMLALAAAASKAQTSGGIPATTGAATPLAGVASTAASAGFAAAQAAYGSGV